MATPICREMGTGLRAVQYVAVHADGSRLAPQPAV
jgi:hypothetical protein